MGKRRGIVLPLVLAIGLLTGCSNSKNMDQEYYKAEISVLEEELDKAMEKIAIYEESYGTIELEDGDSEVKDGKKPKEKKPENIEIGQLVTIKDYGEFTVEDAKLTQRVDPTKPESYYSYYEVKDPKDIYLDLLIKFKNNSTIGLEGSDIIDVKVVYDGKYNYTSFSVAEEAGGGDMDNFGKIDPLSERKIHNIVEMPIEVKDSNKSLVANITIYGKSYSLKIK